MAEALKHAERATDELHELAHGILPAVLAQGGVRAGVNAHASGAAVRAQLADGGFRFVSDDGIGGARPDGSGFVGLADRLAVLDGRLRVHSPTGGGTVVTADIPL